MSNTIKRFFAVIVSCLILFHILPTFALSFSELYVQGVQKGLHPLVAQEVREPAKPDGVISEYSSVSSVSMGDGLFLSTSDGTLLDPSFSSDPLKQIVQKNAVAFDNSYLYIALQVSMPADFDPPALQIPRIGETFCLSVSFLLYQNDRDDSYAQMTNHYYLKSDFSSIVASTAEYIRVLDGVGERHSSMSADDGISYEPKDATLVSAIENGMRNLTLEIRILLKQFQQIDSSISLSYFSAGGASSSLAPLGALFTKFSFSDDAVATGSNSGVITICSGVPQMEAHPLFPYIPIPLTFGKAYSPPATSSVLNALTDKPAAPSDTSPSLSNQAETGVETDVSPFTIAKGDIAETEEPLVPPLPAPDSLTLEDENVYEESDDSAEDSKQGGEDGNLLTILLVISVAAMTVLAFYSIRAAGRLHKADIALENAKKKVKK